MNGYSNEWVDVVTPCAKKAALLKGTQHFSDRLTFLASWKLFQEQFLGIFLQVWSVSLKASR